MNVADDAGVLLAALGLSQLARPAVEARMLALGGLVGVWAAGSSGLGPALSKAGRRRLDAIFALFERVLAQPLPSNRLLDASEVAAIFQRRLALAPVESFWVVMLDVRSRVIGEECVGLGTLSACLVHPREVFAPALRVRAASVLLVHNHPSGDPSPSPEDLHLTERLWEAGKLLGVPVLDHVVVARLGFRSLELRPRRARGVRSAGEGVG